MSISQLRSRNTILCSTSALCIAGGFHVAEDPNHGSFCFASMPQKMNREISRCWKVDSFSFDWPSFPHSSSRRHPLKIPVVPVCHQVSTSSLPETAGWQARTSGAKAGRLGGMRPYMIPHQPFYTNFLPVISTVICIDKMTESVIVHPILNDSWDSDERWSSHAPRYDDTWQLAPHLPTQRLFYHTSGDQDGELGEGDLSCCFLLFCFAGLQFPDPLDLRQLNSNREPQAVTRKKRRKWEVSETTKTVFRIHAC